MTDEVWAEYIKNQSAYWPAPVYLAGLAAISLFAVALTRETQGRSLITSDEAPLPGAAVSRMPTGKAAQLSTG